jgi:hypothetical protein
MPEAAAPPQAAPSRATAQTTTPPASALGAGGVAGLSNEDLHDLFRGAELDDLFRIRHSVDAPAGEPCGSALTGPGARCRTFPPPVGRADCPTAAHMGVWIA